MRGYYLTTRSESGCRGGVGDAHLDSEYELEIGHQCNASPEMIALCVLHDEVIEALKLSGALGSLVHNKYCDLVRELRTKLSEERLNNTD